MGRRREAEKGGGLRQTGVGVKEAESWGGVTQGMCPGAEGGGAGYEEGRSLGSRQPLCLGLLLPMGLFSFYSHCFDLLWLLSQILL